MPRPAASLLVVRQAADGPHLLMGLRGAGHRFMPNRLVFPGGAVDPADFTAPAASELRPEVLTLLGRAAAPELARAVAKQGVRTVIYTDIATDGMGTGPNLPALRELAAAVPELAIIASGGVATVGHVQALAQAGRSIEGVIIGKAIYDGKLKLSDALAAARG